MRTAAAAILVTVALGLIVAGVWLLATSAGLIVAGMGTLFWVWLFIDLPSTPKPEEPS